MHPTLRTILLRDVDAELTILRRRLAQRQQQKAELEQQVHAARRQYQEEIAPLKEEVLRLRVERLRRAAQRHMRSARHRNAYHDAQRAFERFREAQSPSTTPHEDLKGIYRRASKRCHPDVVPDQYHDEAAATFRALEAAYQSGHTRAVEAIADALKQWGFPRGEGSDPNAQELEHLRRAISSLEKSIQALRGTDAYQDLTETGTLDELLRAQKQKLCEQLRALQRR